MTRPYSEAFKQKMIQRLTGKEAVSALQLSKETEVTQQNLSRWLAQARNLPAVGVAEDYCVRRWTVEQKARMLAEGSKLSGPSNSARADVLRLCGAAPGARTVRLCFDVGI